MQLPTITIITAMLLTILFLLIFTSLDQMFKTAASKFFLEINYFIPLFFFTAINFPRIHFVFEWTLTFNTCNFLMENVEKR